MKNVMLCIFLSLFLFSCTNNKKVDLTLLSYKPEYTEVFNKTIEMFKLKNKNVDIKIEEVRNDAISIFEAKLLAGEASDIIMFPSYDVLYKNIEKGYFTDIADAEFKKNISPKFLDGISYDGKLYGFPLNLSVFGVQYNKDIFEKYKINVPNNDKSLIYVCETLEKNGITPFASSIKDAWTLGFLFACGHSSIIGNNNKLWFDSMNSGLGSFRGEKMKYIFDFFDVYKRFSGKNGLEKTYTMQIEDFAKGNAAMMIQNIQSYNMIENLSPQLRVGLFALPFTGEPDETKLFADVENVLVINSRIKSEKKKIALDFLNFLSTDECQNILVKQCKIASSFNVLIKAELPQFHQDILNYTAVNKITLWNFTKWSKGVFELSKGYFHDYLTGRKSRSEITDSLDDSWREGIE